METKYLFKWHSSKLQITLPIPVNEQKLKICGKAGPGMVSFGILIFGWGCAA